MKRILFLWMAIMLLAAVNAVAATPISLPKGAKAGLYVSYDNLQPSGNFVDNSCLTFDGSDWSTDMELMWKDRSTNAFFYAYYPYIQGLKNANSVSFSVKTDQTTDEAFGACDFLYGRVWHNPGDGLPKPVLRHVMAKIVVNIKAGEGITDDDLKEGDLSVRVKDIFTQATINLENGEVRSTGVRNTMVPYSIGLLAFTAVIVPQEVKKISVVWNNVEYVLNLRQYCGSGRQYTFSATLKKTSGGIQVSIGGWEDAGEDFGGTVN